ncbi:MAG: 5-(carboxyamino)imidazole ribonucleotide mutase [Omnitrophica WOR_2 bacterium RIFCSPHIGHO2_01_FULL_48_9]|nr:MAG: 5-(carboxyamino)imidazole ribonucleotide mutase [Omnitrophica WOR_2 bacterium RIFCSPHIGHO2_02_FULL_48_11]OGX31720.1 MAG: 5-(carboxyamino)imidazole ribonucleotide mutase [Omnitrophica WOR_2 bacterium RIFCSPHIGHO2_01_FULL_48_9]
MSKIQVAIMMGSKSDFPTMDETAKILKEFGVGYEMRVLSAHRTPKETAKYAEELQARGVKVVICGAGGSAALAGVVAAHSPLPVIGIPIESVLNGIDSLLSTVQMPPGVPVAAVAIGKPGAKNAGLLAIRILAIADKTLAGKLRKFVDEQRKKILAEKIDT